jgi:hypothetical protein
MLTNILQDIGKQRIGERHRSSACSQNMAGC